MVNCRNWERGYLSRRLTKNFWILAGKVYLEIYRLYCKHGP